MRTTPLGLVTALLVIVGATRSVSARAGHSSRLQAAPRTRTGAEGTSPHMPGSGFMCARSGSTASKRRSRRYGAPPASAAARGLGGLVGIGSSVQDVPGARPLRPGSTPQRIRLALSMGEGRPLLLRRPDPRPRPPVHRRARTHFAHRQASNVEQMAPAGGPPHGRLHRPSRLESGTADAEGAALCQQQGRKAQPRLIPLHPRPRSAGWRADLDALSRTARRGCTQPIPSTRTSA